jgi:hypothetical protein
MRFRFLATKVSCYRWNVGFQCSSLASFCADPSIGATSNDFKRFVSKFYGPIQAATNLASDSVVDRPLLETVWRWLTAHPEVSVGEDREGNALSLSEFEDIEHRNAGQPRHVDSDADAAADDIQPSDGLESNMNNSEPLRMFTSNVRRWQTITGHAPDITLVAPAEFKALCFIAAAGEDGILQPDLIKASGQDKRSLPQRTDRLASNGYIEKRPYYIKNMKTSLLKHRKFCRSAKNESLQGYQPTRKDIFTPGGFDFDNLVTFLVNILESEGPVTLGSLHASLGIETGTTWEYRCLRRGLEKLDAAGIISRFSARRQTLTQSGQSYYVRCIKLNRIPTDEDRRTAHTISRAQLEEFRLRLEKEYKSNEELNESRDTYHDQHLESPIALQDVGDILEAEGLEQAFQPDAFSSLDPDEPFPNAVFRAVDCSGAKGISTIVRRLSSSKRISVNVG